MNLTNIARGPFQNASLGYWVDHRHTGRGLSTAAVRFAVARATELGLHRLEAGTLPHNGPSQVVLRRCGFTEYGRAPQYLFIAGAWQDDVMFQRIFTTGPSCERLPEPSALSEPPIEGMPTRGRWSQHTGTRIRNESRPLR